MKKITFIILIIVIGWYGAPQICAGGEEDAGTDGAAFMKVALGARQAAMGEAFTGLADDAYALNYNPAGLAFLAYNGWEVTFMHNQWIDDTNQNYVAIARPFGKMLIRSQNGRIIQTSRMALSLGAVYFDEGKVDGRYASGELSGDSFSSYDVIPAIGLAFKLHPSISLGIVGRMVHSDLANETSSSFSGDVGLMGNFGYFMIGAAAQNLGSKVKFINEEENHSMLFRGGLAIPLLSRISQPQLNSDAVLVGDVVYRNDNTPTFNVGAEYVFNNVLAIRGGYKINTDIEGLTLGGGVKIGGSKTSPYQIQLDYAYVPLDVIEESIHRIGLTFRFGAATQKRPEEVKPAHGEQDTTKKHVDIGGKREEIVVPDIPKPVEPQQPDDPIEPMPPESPDELIRLRVRVNFDFDKSYIRPDMEGTLSRVGGVLKQAPNSMILLEGHTDNFGTEEYNIGLSYRRVTSVMEWLIKNEGINRNNFLKPVGYGETRPIASNLTAEGRFMNRRTMVIIYMPGIKPDYFQGSTLTNVQVSAGNNQTAVVDLQFNGKVKPKPAFKLNDPDRLIIDIPNVQSQFGKRTFPGGISVLDQVRVASHQEGNFTRVVLDMKGSSYQYQVEYLDSRVQVIVGR